MACAAGGRKGGGRRLELSVREGGGRKVAFTSELQWGGMGTWLRTKNPTGSTKMFTPEKKIVKLCKYLYNVFIYELEHCD